MHNIQQWVQGLAKGDIKSIAKALSAVENKTESSNELLEALPFKNNTPIIGITGPPGAGKSSIVNACINELLKKDKKIAILAVDPSSPFNYGSLLGDRVRMDSHFNNKNVFIRSVASRGHLGGLSTRIYEMADVLRNTNYDYIFIETVGVGQSEVEIAGIADITVVVLVPEAGDEIQTMKSGVMEIANLFVVNKSDREGSDRFTQNLLKLVHTFKETVPVIKTSTIEDTGINKLIENIEVLKEQSTNDLRKNHLLASRAWQILSSKLMEKYHYSDFLNEIKELSQQTNFNLYRYINEIYDKHH
jgi:LAO/AO transport system kinase